MTPRPLVPRVAMDTSSPWGEEGEEGGAGEAGWADFSTASQEEAHGGDGWADFGAMAEAPQDAAAAPSGGDAPGFGADFGSLTETASADAGDSGSQGDYLQDWNYRVGHHKPIN